MIYYRGDNCDLPDTGSESFDLSDSNFYAPTISKKPPRGKHKRSVSDGVNNFTEITSSGAGSMTGRLHRRSKSGDIPSVMHNNVSTSVVLTAIDFLSKRAESLRNSQDSESESTGTRIAKRVNSFNGITSDSMLCNGIAVPDGSVVDDEFDELSAMLLDLSNPSSPPRQSYRSVEDVISEYEYIINELQAMLAGAYDDNASLMSFPSQNSIDNDDDSEHSWDLASAKGLSFVPDRSSEFFKSGDDDSEEASVRRFKYLLQDRDNQILKLNEQLQESRDKFAIFKANSEHTTEELKNNHAKVICEKDAEIKRLSDALKSVGNEAQTSSLMVDNNQLAGFKSSASFSCGKSSDISAEEKDSVVFSFDEYDNDYSEPSQALALRLSIAAAKEREMSCWSPCVLSSEATPRLAMEDIIESAEHSEVGGFLKANFRKVASFGGKETNPVWTDIETIMSCINRVSCDLVRSTKEIDFSDLKILLQNTENFEFLKTLEVVRPLIGHHFKSIIANFHEAVDIWSRLDRFLDDDINYKDLLQVMSEVLLIL